MRILVCSDGSEASRAAAPVARMLATAPDSTIEVIRVVRAPRRYSSGRTEPVGSLIAFGGAPAADLHELAAERRWQADQAAYDADLQEALASARAACDPLLEALPHGTELHVTTTEGEVADAIIAHARSTHADLIVMTTHSRAPMTELFMGSVARAVVASGVAPVTLIHPA